MDAGTTNEGEDLKSCSLSDGFILPSSEEDGIGIGYGTVFIVFARFLISARQLLLQQRATTSDTQSMNHR